MNKIEIWIFGIVVVIALLVMYLGATMTGNASKHTTYTQIYRSCHYLDYDARGECVRIERQNSNHCEPEETIPEQLLGSYGQRPMNWFYRLCYDDKRPW